MTTYTLSEAKQNLEAVLDEADRRGGIEIRREDGRTFSLRPAERRSALDVRGVDTGVTAAEIVDAVREVRERGGTLDG